MKDLDWIPELGRSPGEGNSYPFQYSVVENSMDCIVHGVAKSWTWLCNLRFTFINVLLKTLSTIFFFISYCIKSPGTPLAWFLKNKMYFKILYIYTWGFPDGASGKEPAYQCRRHKRLGFDLWVGKIRQRRAWQPTAWRIPWTEEASGFSGSQGPQGCKELDTTEVT